MTVMTKGRPQPVDALTSYFTMTRSQAEAGVSATTLRAEMAKGRIRGLRDPLGRRLLWGPDVLAYAEARRQQKERELALLTKPKDEDRS
jgi:hypothetical protein